jgi:hypothetical protein
MGNESKSEDGLPLVFWWDLSCEQQKYLLGGDDFQKCQITFRPALGSWLASQGLRYLPIAAK